MVCMQRVSVAESDQSSATLPNQTDVASLSTKNPSTLQSRHSSNSPSTLQATPQTPSLHLPTSYLPTPSPHHPITPSPTQSAQTIIHEAPSLKPTKMATVSLSQLKNPYTPPSKPSPSHLKPRPYGRRKRRTYLIHHT